MSILCGWLFSRTSFSRNTAGDIADRASDAGPDFKVEKRHVILDEPIKVLGANKVLVRLHQEVEVEIDVSVEREED